MSTDYTYLFPFEKIPCGSRIVIYGAGVMGFEYLKQVMITKYAEIVCFIDRNYKTYDGYPIPVYPAEKLRELDFDYVVLAFQVNSYEKVITDFLIELGIEKRKIIGVFTRPRLRLTCIQDDNYNLSNVTFAFETSDVSIAVKLNGSLGDNIIRKKVVEALVSMMTNCCVDLYSPVANKLLKSLYTDVSQVKNFIDDGGSKFVRYMDNYTIGISINNFIKVESENLEAVKNNHKMFYEKMKLLINRCNEYRVDFSVPLYTFFSRAIKRGKNCYTVYDYDGVFEINDKNVHIALNEDYNNSFRELGLKNYITINYGNAVSMGGGKQIAKQWPLERFEQLITMLHERYPEYEVVQLGGADAVLMKGADRRILGHNFEMVKYVLAESTLHIDIEGGLVHLATQLGTKCVVLFGPTQEAYFGYEGNINIKQGECHDCYGMCMDINQCARDMERPECMYGITVEMVMERIEKIKDLFEM